MYKILLDIGLHRFKFTNDRNIFDPIPKYRFNSKYFETKKNIKRKCQINLTKIFIKIVLYPSKRLRWRKYQFPHILSTYIVFVVKDIFFAHLFFLPQNVIYSILIPWPCATFTMRISRICCVCTHLPSLAFLIPI